MKISYIIETNTMIKNSCGSGGCNFDNEPRLIYVKPSYQGQRSAFAGDNLSRDTKVRPACAVQHIVLPFSNKGSDSVRRVGTR